MKKNSILFITLAFLSGTFACITPKEAQQLKKATADWRESPAVLEAYADGPFSGTFLILRENTKFEHTSSGMLQSFEAGSWNRNHDTINLYYVNSAQQIKQHQKVYIDRNTSTLIFEGDTLPEPMRLRIVICEL
ncbi:hypothetical protein [Cytophaga hutchinsonii]|uniref:Lipocalin-like domain-containing protein n=1 Tax=Cytophaga hutchinsonii (strain ATCC 33406 / DSM 1761 / CIP 103989 / NBRC 15051 / NCIMB 9469 / D465) TaxID=269798 RepID=A0A6N4STT7_CYTH3|nr:hypothetical protein [Cytophaga hutchinsonii]ABG59806.1 hypothetical protein CHU_2553 [Cytophaga hutchinsonii ATCC 33406]SFX29491.1 hypothetical protein SAMN04487930_102497 [Cytophaga hutchinsonii ATCC 33406]